MNRNKVSYGEGRKAAVKKQQLFFQISLDNYSR